MSFFRRRPAWCDRILYCVNSHNYENVTLKADQLSYKSHPSYLLSDHKPVSAEFNIKVSYFLFIYIINTNTRKYKLLRILTVIKVGINFNCLNPNWCL